ncbi:hypothetical protein Q8A67_008464 [Cirrhinus molitorella]|uniref:Tyrosine-protein phosphatase domain-containing protein n=1 Tax=Cirrhinus molitorella TaxID=172907 RepID=A0AA88TPJ6_9TELE|nr:hypothetical protein Q8A67_008464 [Cirrhinus molitorella]
MSTEVREVCLEVYVDGVFYSGHSYWALNDKDVQLEFEITNAIYDLIGCSASQEVDVKLLVQTDDRISVSYCCPEEMKVKLEVDGNEDIPVCEVKDLQLVMNRKGPALVSGDLSDQAANDQGGLDAAENKRPAGSAAGWKMFRKMSAVFQRLTAVFQTKTVNAVEESEVDLIDLEEWFDPDPIAPEPEPEMDLVDIKQSCVPDPSVPEPEPAGPLVEVASDQDSLDAEENSSPTESTAGWMMFRKMRAVFQTNTVNAVEEPEVDQIDPGEWFDPDPIAPEPEPEMDLVDTKQSCVPDPSVPEPEPAGPLVEMASDQGGLDAEENSSPTESTAGWTMFGKMRAVFQTNTENAVEEPEVDLINPGEWFDPDPVAPEPEPEMDLVNIKQSCVPDPSVPEPEPAGPLVEMASDQDSLDAEENSSPTECIAERKTKKKKKIFQRFCAVFQRKTLKPVGKPEVGLLDPDESFIPDPIAPEPEPEMDLVGIEQSCVPDPSVPEPEPAGPLVEVASDQDSLDAEENSSPTESEPEMGLADTKQSWVPDPSVPEPEPALVEVASDQGGLDAEENSSPTERTAKRKTKKKKKIFQRFPAVFQRKTQKPVEEPKVDLLDPDESFIPDPIAPKPEPEADLVAPSEPQLDLIDQQESCVRQTKRAKEMKTKKVPGFIVRTLKKITSFLQNDRTVGVSAWPETDLSDSEPEDASFECKWDLVDSVELTPWTHKPESESESEDLVDSEESSVSDLSISELPPEWDSEEVRVPETVASMLSMLEHYVPRNVVQLEDRLKRCRLRKRRPVSLVWPRVFIGDEEIATDKDELEEMCITHILNAAAPKKDLDYYLGLTLVADMKETINTGSRYYKGLRLKYCGMPTTERHCSDVSKCFVKAAKFIDNALRQRASKVLICCKQGDNHSATLFLAYLMVCHDMMLEEAIDHTVKSRRIMPSRDFLEKLMVLNADLVEQRRLKLQDIQAGKKKRRKWQLKRTIAVPHLSLSTGFWERRGTERIQKRRQDDWESKLVERSHQD